MATKVILLVITSIAWISNKIKSHDYLTSNSIQINQISSNLLKGLNVEHLECTKEYFIKKLNLTCDASHNLDSWIIPWDRFFLDGDIK